MINIVIGGKDLSWHREVTKTDWQPCVQPFSFYHEFIPDYWASGATEVASAPIHRLCTLARKMGVKSFHVEDALDRPEIVSEIRHLEDVSAGTDGEVTARAITFLRVAKESDNQKLVTLAECDVIGQAVIVTYPMADGNTHSFVYEAIFRLCARDGETLLLNNQVPIATEFPIEIGDQSLVIKGSYFCQQNGISSVCAHSAVRTLLMNHGKRRISVAELNATWKIDPSLGKIRITDVTASLDEHGLTLIRYWFKGKRSNDAMTNDGIWSLIASLALSGTPTLLVFETGPKFDHVVPVLGHTLNTDEWHPQGSLTHLADANRSASSSLWIDHLVINDDQLGPYYCMSRSGLFEDGKSPTAIKPTYVVAMLPKGFVISPFAAETLAREEFERLLLRATATLADAPRWSTLLRTTAERRVFRTTLIARDEYAAGVLAQLPAGGRAEAEATVARIVADLPDAFWMCEVSLPNIMLANKTKLGEILLSTSRKQIHAVRLPGVIATLKPETLSAFPFPINGHIPIHEPHHNPNQW